MTTIRFDRTGGRLSGFRCAGHSGYAEAGADIVCAAVSSAVTLTECILNDALQAGARVSVDETTAEVTLALSPSGPHREACEKVLEGFLLYMRELSHENPQNIKVLEV